MDLWPHLLAFVGLGVTVWAMLRYHRRHDELERLWKHAANSLGGRFERSVGTLRGRDTLRIFARDGDLDVTLEYVARGARGRGADTTEIRAEAPGSSELRLQLFRENALAPISKALGVQDITVGEPGFDDRFLVQASDPDLARAWLDEESRRAIGDGALYQFGIEGGEARALRVGGEDSVKRLVEVVGRVVVLATAGRRLLARWEAASAELAGTVTARSDGFEPGGRVLTVVERAGVRALLDAVRIEGRGGRGISRTWTRLRARHGRGEGARFAVLPVGPLPPASPAPDLVEVGADGWKPPGDLFAARAPGGHAPDRLREPDLWRRIEALGPAALLGDEREVTVLLEGVVLDAPRLGAALDLALLLASPSTDGPYR